jgi:hypothetical protein
MGDRDNGDGGGPDLASSPVGSGTAGAANSGGIRDTAGRAGKREAFAMTADPGVRRAQAFQAAGFRDETEYRSEIQIREVMIDPSTRKDTGRREVATVDLGYCPLRLIADPDRTLSAIAAVLVERKAQDVKWGDENIAGGVVRNTEAISILGEEFGELCQCVNRKRWNYPNVAGAVDWTDQRIALERRILEEAVQTAAVAVAMVEAAAGRIAELEQERAVRAAES